LARDHTAAGCARACCSQTESSGVAQMRLGKRDWSSGVAFVRTPAALDGGTHPRSDLPRDLSECAVERFDIGVVIRAADRCLCLEGPCGPHYAVAVVEHLHVKAHIDR